MDPLSVMIGSLIAEMNPGSPGIFGRKAISADGEFLQRSQPIQELTVMRTIYRGDCPGERVTPVRGMSFLASLPPAGNQRIVIRNRRTGGYTNREYGSGRRRSESFSISLGSRHHGSFLSVTPGENQFRWSVTKARNVDAATKGNATLMVNTQDRERFRNFRSIDEDAFCPGEEHSYSRTPLGECRSGYFRIKRQGICPDGSKVELGSRIIYRRY